jgi:hypothetical protein
MLLGDGSKRLGDIVAGTVVVYRDEVAPLAAIREDASALAPTEALQLAEQRALIEFVRRDAGFTPERSGELALIADPLVDEHTPAAARSRLLAMGRYLMGHR